MNEKELFSDSEESRSEKSSRNLKVHDFEEKNENMKKKHKIEEILQISDSDSENHRDLGLFDLTYEQFIERKKGFSKEKKHDFLNLNEKIRNLQINRYFQEEKPQKIEKIEAKKEKIEAKNPEIEKISSNNGKIKEKYQEISSKSSFSNKNEFGFQELEDLKSFFLSKGFL